MPYRIEMALATLAVLAILFYWRLLVVGTLDVAATVFWLLWPDLAAFVPLGLASRGGSPWPSWGSILYNVTHSFAVWSSVFLLWSFSSGQIVWPLLAWAGHISADRALGYYLRSRA
jgi:hypothetical protein